jgi:serine/threonine protein kinase
MCVFHSLSPMPRFRDAGSIKDYLVDNPERQGTRTLVEMLRLKRRMSISIDPTLCALLTSLDIAEALKFMHKSKTLHGDLKPHNILLVSTPQVRLAWS